MHLRNKFHIYWHEKGGTHWRLQTQGMRFAEFPLQSYAHQKRNTHLILGTAQRAMALTFVCLEDVIVCARFLAFSQVVVEDVIVRRPNRHRYWRGEQQVPNFFVPFRFSSTINFHILFSLIFLILRNIARSFPSAECVECVRVRI